MNRFLKIIITTLILAGCAGKTVKHDWNAEYTNAPTGTPVQMQYGTYYSIYDSPDTQHNIAVLLPTTGQSAAAGQEIRNAMELALLQHSLNHLNVNFFDTAKNATGAINAALQSNPDIIVGPLFSSDAQILRTTKPEFMPAISFTSDANAVGDGVLTVALMPTNSVELIVREMFYDGIQDFIIMAPDSDSGKIMAGTAKRAAEIYGPNVAGVFFYQEHNNENLKNTAQSASMSNARIAANKRARTVLSDILTNETLSRAEKSNMYYQLDKISKSDTLGALPYSAVLFLGTVDDTKTLGSFLRYYGADSRSVKFYGTALLDGTDIASDYTMIGTKYAALPEQNQTFVNLYKQTYGTYPSRLATFGFDAANIAMGTVYSNKTPAAYLLDPSGYAGMDGIVRLKPNGDSERGLRIMQTNGSGTPVVVRNAPENFINPIYNIEQRQITPASEMSLQTRGINPNDFIRIPDRFRSKYKSETYGINMTEPEPQPRQNVITVINEPASQSTVIDTEYKPVKLESINKTMIDSVEINE